MTRIEKSLQEERRTLQNKLYAKLNDGTHGDKEWERMMKRVEGINHMLEQVEED